MSFKSPILALFIACHCAPGAARDVNGQYAVFGSGSHSCSHYLAARDIGGEDEQRYIEWISGHLSAYNLLLANTYNILGDSNAFELMARLDSHCRRERDQPFVQALAIQMETLYPVRTSVSPNSSGWEDWLKDIRRGETAE